MCFIYENYKEDYKSIFDGNDIRDASFLRDG